MGSAGKQLLDVRGAQDDGGAQAVGADTKSIDHKRVERTIREYKLNSKVRHRRFPKDYYRTMKESWLVLHGCDQGPLQRRDRVARKVYRSQTVGLVTDVVMHLRNRGGSLCGGCSTPTWAGLIPTQDMSNSPSSSASSRAYPARGTAETTPAWRTSSDT